MVPREGLTRIQKKLESAQEPQAERGEVAAGEKPVVHTDYTKGSRPVSTRESRGLMCGCHSCRGAPCNPYGEEGLPANSFNKHGGQRSAKGGS